MCVRVPLDGAAAHDADCVANNVQSLHNRNILAGDFFMKTCDPLCIRETKNVQKTIIICYCVICDDSPNDPCNE